MHINKGLLTGCVVFVLWGVIFLFNLRHFQPVVFSQNSGIFGADTQETSQWMRQIGFDQDMRKHLLFSVVTSPAVKVIRGVFNNISEDNAIILVLAIIAACNITLAYVTLVYFLPNVFQAFWFSALYGMMFSNLVVFSIPETYSLSGLFILFYFLCLFKMKHLSPLYLSITLGVIAGTASLFNPPLLSLVAMQVIWIIRNQPTGTHKYRACLWGVSIAVILYALPNLLIHGKSYFDYAIPYIHMYASLKNFLNLYNVGTVVLGFLFYSFISPMDMLADNVPFRYFQNYFLSLPKIILLVIYAIILAYGIKIWRSRKEIMGPLAIWCLLIVCFYIYFNPLEAMLYSPTMTFPIILFISWAFVNISGRMKYYGLAAFTLLLLAQNFGTLYAPLKP
jgi:hypothetical protein